MTNCPNQEQLQAFTRGDLPEESADDLLAHLDTCLDCRSTLNFRRDSKTSRKRAARQQLDSDPILKDPFFQRAVTEIRQLDVNYAMRRDHLEEYRPHREDAQPDLVGQQLDQYRIVAKLGEGGMGTVYKAVHIKLDKEVALKILPAGRLASQERVARFEREMLSVGRLSHPHIVGATDARELDGSLFLVMEYLQGIDLSALTERFAAPLSVCDACEMIRQAAIGLEYAYQHGFVHRDIKPSNLMLTTEGLVKILDLGLALAQSHEDEENQLTSTGQIMGTIEYMAPEQIDHSHTVDIRADLYSLGCTLYKLLTGDTPFGHLKSSSTFRRMKARIEEPSPSVSQHCRELPNELAAIVDRLLAKNPAERFDDPQQLVLALEPFAVGSDLATLARKAVQPDVNRNSQPNETLASLATADVETAAARKHLRHPPESDASGQPALLASKERRLFSMPKLVTGAAVLLASLLIAVWIQVATDKGAVTPEPVKAATWQLGPAEGVIPGGLIPRPAELPGVLRWQVFTRQPRGCIQELAWSPDNKWLAATVGVEGAVRLYDSATGRLARVLPQSGVPEFIYRGALTWSPDSQTLSALDSGYSRYLRLWQVNEGVSLHLPEIRDVRSVAWHPSGKWVAAASADDSAFLVSRDGSVRKKLPGGKTGGEVSLGWSPDGNWLAAAWRDDKKTRLWNVDGTPGPVVEGIFTSWHPDGRQFVTADVAKRQLQFWNLDGEAEKTIDGFIDVSWRPGNASMVFRAPRSIGDGAERIDYQADEDSKPKTVARQPGHGFPGGMLWSRDDSTLTTFHGQSVAFPGHLFYVAGNDLRQADLNVHQPGLNAVALSPDGEQIACGLASLHSEARELIQGMIEVYDIRQSSKREFTRRLPKAVDVSWHPDGSRFAWVSSVEWDTDGKTLASLDNHGEVHTWDENGRSRIAAPSGKHFRQNSVVFSRIAPTQFSRKSNDGVHEHPANIPPEMNAVVWSEDGRRFAAFRWGSSTLYIGSADGSPARKIEFSQDIYAACVSPDGSRLAVFIDAISGLIMVDTANGQQSKASTAPRRLNAVSWRADGQMLACVGMDPINKFNDILLFLSDGTPGPPLEDAHRFGGMGSVAFSKDGKRLIAGGPFGIAIWDLATRKIERICVPLPDHQAAVFSPAGELLFSTADAADELVYVVEQESGKFETLTPADFHSQILSNVSTTPPDSER